MTKRTLISFLFLFDTSFLFNQLFSQQQGDTLPKFSLKNVGGNRIVIGWVNEFESVKQISIQRSFDSLKNFKTILTVADPSIPENGYVDTKASNDHMFYRLYIMLDKGAFLFSDPKRPVLDTVVKRDAVRTDLPQMNIPVIIKDSVLIGPVNGNNRPKADVYVPSKRVFTFKDGYVRIVLPSAGDKKYNIKFFTPEDEMLFELKDIKEKDFKIDKTNFYHSGWFKFELYEDDALLEKNKFYLPKEF
jgi:hypothetical protein